MSGKFIRRAEAGAKAYAPSELQGLLIDTATYHSDALGYNGDYFAREKKGWVLLRFHAEIERLPRKREPLVIETWPSKGRGLAAERSFRMLDEAGATLAKAVSQWVYFDLVRRRPSKMPQELVEKFTSGIENALPVTKYTIEAPPESAKIAESRLTVRRSNTDSNMHVNNVEYIKWAEDGIPDGDYYGGGLKSVCVNYRREAAAGDTLVVTSYEVGGGKYTHYIKGEDGSVCAEILMGYKKN